MTDNEIIKALECCGRESCNGCPYRNGKCHQGNPMIRDARDLINRQRAEIEQLKRNLAQCENGYKQELHRARFEIERLAEKYNLAVAEREANVKGFAEDLSNIRLKTQKEFASKIINAVLPEYLPDYEANPISQVIREMIREEKAGAENETQ